MTTSYTMEELIPIVAELADRYTASNSTSISNAKAQQLMAAVLYCIQAAETEQPQALISKTKMPATQAYKLGYRLLEQKTQQALVLYNELLADFSDYGNYFLRNTVVNGLPEFFKWYDLRFEPQNNILTLDYPILQNLANHTGIHLIYAYIQCLLLEQRFLRQFPPDYIRQSLAEYNPFYQDTPDNLCEVMIWTQAKRSAKEQNASPDELRIKVDFWRQNLYNIIQQQIQIQAEDKL